MADRHKISHREKSSKSLPGDDIIFLMGRLSDSIKKLSHSLGFNKEESAADESVDLSRLDDSASESEIEEVVREDEEDSEDESAEESEEDVPLSDVEIDDDADVVTHQRKTIDNHGALRAALKRIELPTKAKNIFYEHMSVTAPEKVVLRDIYDDTERELAFYAQALNAAKVGRTELSKAKIPFSRPVDFYAEMVKSDEHMEKLRQKLVSEETEKRARQEAKKQRELKKFGKKVQVAQLQKRQKEKRETLDKIKDLKRKRDDLTEDQFDVGVEDALKDKRAARNEKYGLSANAKRQKKNQKYGNGGKKRGINKNTKESSMDVSDFKKKRPGKSKRR